MQRAHKRRGGAKGKLLKLLGLRTLRPNARPDPLSKWHVSPLPLGPKESRWNSVAQPDWWTKTRANDFADDRPIPKWARSPHPSGQPPPRATLPLNETFCRNIHTSEKDARRAQAQGFVQEGVGKIGRLGRVLDERGIIFFTHLRRTSGTMLEDCFLKPAIAHLIGRGTWQARMLAFTR